MNTVKFGFLAVALAALGATASVPVDGIVARVDDGVILRSEVLGEMARIGEYDAAAARKVLDELINRRLIVKAAHDQKMTMQDWVVENRVREIIQRGFDGDRNRLMDQLARDRISYPEWHARIKDDMIISAMRYQTVDKNVIATPAAVRAEYAAHPERYSEKSGKVSVTVILLASDETDRLATATFEEDGYPYENIRPEEVFLPDVCEAINALEKGESSKWLVAKDHYFRVRKDDEEVGALRPLRDAYREVEAAVRQAESERLYKEWTARLRGNSYVRIYED